MSESSNLVKTDFLFKTIRFLVSIGSMVSLDLSVETFVALLFLEKKRLSKPLKKLIFYKKKQTSLFYYSYILKLDEIHVVAKVVHIVNIIVLNQILWSFHLI